jgi:hypothetical protein
MDSFFFWGINEIEVVFQDIEERAKLSESDQRDYLRLKSKFCGDPRSLTWDDQNDLMALWNKSW